MTERFSERDTAANLLERRWFSSISAVRAAEAECETLRVVMELAESAWRRARLQLAELETLRDALDDELAALDEIEAPPQVLNLPQPHRAMSAA